MPSSTSSSEAYAEAGADASELAGLAAIAGPTWRVWLSALGIALAVLLALETTWRVRGHLPSISDDEAYWAYQRGRIAGDPDVLVLLGDSRIQVGFSLETFRERHPGWRVVQLAISGHGPLPVLTDLARDRRFVGSVVSDLRAEQLGSGPVRESARSYVDHYRELWLPHERWPYHDGRARASLFAALQARLSLLSPETTLARVAKHLIEEGSLPDAPHTTMRLDRSRRSDYSRVDTPQLRAALERLVERRDPARSLPASRWQTHALEIARAARAIEERGGRVAIVRFPSSPGRFAAEDRLYPRAAYWDVLAEQLGTRAIHYRDVPALARSLPADSAHLDYRDKPAFTNALLDELERRGMRFELRRGASRQPR